MWSKDEYTNWLTADLAETLDTTDGNLYRRCNDLADSIIGKIPDGNGSLLSFKANMADVSAYFDVRDETCRPAHDVAID